MTNKFLRNSFIEFCKENNLEINKRQIQTIDSISKFLNPRNKILDFFIKNNKKKCFYLYGDVGVGKTMILNFVYNQLKKKKIRFHFNEFMINFHNFRHKKKDQTTIFNFVQNLKKKTEILYLDEFQVTNIVDAMILGKLFQVIFSENIKIMISTNVKVNDLYKDGLQREQFIPFLELIKNNSHQQELFLDEDYRKQFINKNQSIFYPLNEKTSFDINLKFRRLTKNIQKEERKIHTKGRDFKISTYYKGITRFNFKDLCDQNLGSEDYLNLSKICIHIFIEGIPDFDDYNSNQQLRFITLIDILYEKNINLTLSLSNELQKLNSSKKHFNTFKRTVSRLYEMTKPNN